MYSCWIRHCYFGRLLIFQTWIQKFSKFIYQQIFTVTLNKICTLALSVHLFFYCFFILFHMYFCTHIIYFYVYLNAIKFKAIQIIQLFTVISIRKVGIIKDLYRFNFSSYSYLYLFHFFWKFVYWFS